MTHYEPFECVKWIKHKIRKFNQSFDVAEICSRSGKCPLSGMHTSPKWIKQKDQLILINEFYGFSLNPLHKTWSKNIKTQQNKTNKTEK